MTSTGVAGDLRSRVSRVTGRLAELVATPLVPSDYLDLFDPLRSTAALRGKVREVHPETRDAVTLVIEPGRGWSGHRAGQYVRIGVDVDGVRSWRTYSTTSPVRPDGCLTLTVKAHPGGLVSNFLVRRSRPGLVLQLEQAAGDFVLPETRPAKALFVTAGSGITPVMGMLREAVHELPDVVLVHSAPTADDVIFARELRALASRGSLRLIERHTAQEPRLTVQELARLVPDLAERETWACGPGALLDALAQRFAELGATDHLHLERFRVEPVVIGDGGDATFARSAVTVSAGPATPLLEAGEAAGVLMPSGCRMGVCFSCVVPLREGAVRDLRDGSVTLAGDGVLIQTCVSAAAGACALDV